MREQNEKGVKVTGKFQTVMWKDIYEMAASSVIEDELSRKCSHCSRVSANG